jgi:hypothetical protein
MAEVKSEEYLIILTIHHQSRLPGSNPVFKDPDEQ